MLRSPRPSTLFASARRAWRGSLQLRVVTITLVATSALVATFGLFLSKRITDGLVQAKESSAIQIVKRDSTAAGENLNSQISDPTEGSAPANVAQNLSNTNRAAWTCGSWPTTAGPAPW